jgi:hypothetical protein
MEHLVHVVAGTHPELIEREFERVGTRAANAGPDYVHGHVSSLQGMSNVF